jgi:hypothetical protein
MKAKISLLLAVLSIMLIGCSSHEQEVSAKGVTFEIKEFHVTYSDTALSKSYSGQGTILAVGDPETVKKPYIVLVKYEKVKGGNPTEEKKGVLTVNVFDGIGEVTTYDSTFKKGDKIEKPEYKFEVVGYIPLVPVKTAAPKSHKISFKLKDFHVKYEEELVSSQRYPSIGLSQVYEDSYAGNGTIIVAGSTAEVNKPYIIMLRLKKVKGGLDIDSDNWQLKTVPVVQGIGSFYTNDAVFRVVLFGQDVSPVKLERPEYKIEIIGYKQGSAA